MWPGMPFPVVLHHPMRRANLVTGQSCTAHSQCAFRLFHHPGCPSPPSLLGKSPGSSRSNNLFLILNLLNLPPCLSPTHTESAPPFPIFFLLPSPPTLSFSLSSRPLPFSVSPHPQGRTDPSFIHLFCIIAHITLATW